MQDMDNLNRMMTGILKKAKGLLVRIASPLFIPIIKQMANSGDGTNRCLKHGCLPVAVHYYQPVPDIAELEKRKVWDKVSSMRGIRFEPQKYVEFLTRLSKEYAAECDWPNERSSDPGQFYLNNGSFSYGCAAPLHCIVRHNKPRRIIEIGSGNSSKVIAEALRLNLLENCETDYTIIDPYSELDVVLFPQHTTIVREPVELVDIDVFKSLEEDDILFIDSSHTCKIGSDVNYEILEILPRLKKGVFVHFHDIPLPYEYPKTYATNPKFRVFWTESYLLQAFLACNSDFDIVLPMAYLQKRCLDVLKQAFPCSHKAGFGWESGSFWIVRVATTEMNENPGRDGAP